MKIILILTPLKVNNKLLRVSNMIFFYSHKKINKIFKINYKQNGNRKKINVLFINKLVYKIICLIVMIYIKCKS